MCENQAGEPESDVERQWVERAQAGDSQAFRLLVEHHQHRVYGIALRILRSPADAEEAAQDALVRAWKALPGFRGESRFGTWLHRIAVRQALDRVPKIRQRKQREIPLDREEVRSDSCDPPDHVVQLRMERLIACLSETQRTVATLFYYQDRSVEEVSKALDMPIGTVKTHLSRARAALRSAWLDQESEKMS